LSPGASPSLAQSQAALPAASPSLSSLIDALKLPPGSWSASILSFAKFFSLPLEGDLVALIRRKVLEAEVPPRPPAAAAGKGAAGAEGGEVREALSLAALAAHAKGVDLSPEALADYARALRRGREQDSPVEERPESPAEGGENGGEGGEEAAGHRTLQKVPQETLKTRVLAAQGPLLSLLNRLPDKGGRRWIVLPFSLDRRLECCLRILLVPQAGPAAYRAERLSLDIMGGEEPGSPRSWTFHFRDTPRLEIFCRPAPAREEAEALEGELAALLGLPPGSVRFGDGEFPAFAEDSRDWTLPSLNKEV
jgi:hypothetical protein